VEDDKKRKIEEEQQLKRVEDDKKRKVEEEKQKIEEEKKRKEEEERRKNLEKWTEYYDEGSNGYYYFNPKTQATTWVKPKNADINTDERKAREPKPIIKEEVKQVEVVKNKENNDISDSKKEFKSRIK